MSKSPSLRRIQADVRELLLDPSDRYHAAPLENDMFEWHFTIRGADGTDFEGGIYHGRILLPPEYPFKPPHIIFLTPSGRFEINTKICLSFSAFHPELWQPAWGIRLILEALIAFLPSPTDGAIGALDWTSTERQRFAKKSQQFCCPRCGKIADLLPQLKDGGDTRKEKAFRFEKEIEQLRLAQIANETKNDKTDKIEKGNTQSQSTTVSENDRLSGAETEHNIDENAENLPLSVNEQGTPPMAQTRTGNGIVHHEDAPVAPPPGDGEAANPFEDYGSWITDPVLNVTIVVLAVICCFLVRQTASLLAELQTLSAR